MPRIVALLILLSLSDGASASASVQEPADTARRQSAEALRVFLDCRSRFCDFDHFRREITFVNYVRDRTDAQVHILVTTRRTGAGGQEFTFAFIGAADFTGVDDSLQYFSSQTDTDDEIRSGLTQLLKLGLVRYAAHTPIGERLDITYVSPDTTELTPQVWDDPWNYWIFRIRVGAFLNGEERQSFLSGNGSLSANRTTEDWKTTLSAFAFYGEDHFEFEDGSTFTSISRTYGTDAFVARSLGEHWSAAAVIELRHSTFDNLDMRIEAAPGVEYNVFPYSESTRRALTFAYFVGVNIFDYMEVTLFDKTTETRPTQLLEISYSIEQPFGTVNTTLRGSNFLDDFSQHRIQLRARLAIRLVRGLDLNLSGRIARIKDQIFLPKEGATDEEVLVRQRALGTDYSYFMNIGLSYTFGSIFNNVVNPRFD